MMAERSVVAVYDQLTLILDLQFRGTSAIGLFHYDAALEGGVLCLEGLVLGLKGIQFLGLLDLEGLVLNLEGLQVLGLLDLEGLKASLQRGDSARVGGLCDIMW